MEDLAFQRRGVVMNANGLNLIMNKIVLNQLFECSYFRGNKYEMLEY